MCTGANGIRELRAGLGSIYYMCIHIYTHKYYKHIHIYNIRISSIDTYMYNTCTGARGSGNIYVYTIYTQLQEVSVCRALVGFV